MIAAGRSVVAALQRRRRQESMPSCHTNPRLAKSVEGSAEPWMERSSRNSSRLIELRLRDECKICLEDIHHEQQALSGLYTISPCGHVWHRSCLSNYVDSSICDGHLDISCPSCPTPLLTTDIDRLTAHGAKYKHLVYKRKVDQDPDLIWCTTPGCEGVISRQASSCSCWLHCLDRWLFGSSSPSAWMLAVVVSTWTGQAVGLALGSPSQVACAIAAPVVAIAINWDRGDPVQHAGVRATCKTCHKSSCLECKSPWHTGKECTSWKQVQIWASSVGADVNSCPKCTCVIERTAGCNHMTCKACKHEFCWLCGANYHAGHFGDNMGCSQHGGNKKQKRVELMTYSPLACSWLAAFAALWLARLLGFCGKHFRPSNSVICSVIGNGLFWVAAFGLAFEKVANWVLRLVEGASDDAADARRFRHLRRSVLLMCLGLSCVALWMMGLFAPLQQQSLSQLFKINVLLAVMTCMEVLPSWKSHDSRALPWTPRWFRTPGRVVTSTAVPLFIFALLAAHVYVWAALMSHKSLEPVDLNSTSSLLNVSTARVPGPLEGVKTEVDLDHFSEASNVLEAGLQEALARAWNLTAEGNRSTHDLQVLISDVKQAALALSSEQKNQVMMISQAAATFTQNDSQGERRLSLFSAEVRSLGRKSWSKSLKGTSFFFARGAIAISSFLGTMLCLGSHTLMCHQVMYDPMGRVPAHTWSASVVNLWHDSCPGRCLFIMARISAFILLLLRLDTPGPVLQISAVHAGAQLFCVIYLVVLMIVIRKYMLKFVCAILLHQVLCVDLAIDAGLPAELLPLICGLSVAAYLRSEASLMSSRRFARGRSMACAFLGAFCGWLLWFASSSEWAHECILIVLVATSPLAVNMLALAWLHDFKSLQF